MGVVFDIKRGSVKDGPGIRTSVFLKGCPLRCVWCHNPESQSPEIQKAVMTEEVCGREMSVEEVMGEVRLDKMFYERSGGGVTFTGGEPMLQFAFTRELCAAAKAEGIRVALDTCGEAPWGRFDEIMPFVDLFLYDYKATGVERHRELTGVDGALILSNLRRLSSVGAKIWLRCPIVPGVNDTPEHEAMIGVLGGLPGVERIDRLPYHEMGLEKYVKFGLTNKMQSLIERQKLGEEHDVT